MRLTFRPHPFAILAGMAALSLGGCAESDLHQYLGHTDTLTVGAGNAHAANRAIHEVDHWPETSRRTQIDLDGRRAALAVKRYQKNESIDPKGLTKRDVSVSGPDPGAAVKQ
jgi:hypothetical protein